MVVEVRDECQALAASRRWEEMQQELGGCERIVLLLDNMTPDMCAIIHSSLIEGLREWCILEGSGEWSLMTSTDAGMQTWSQLVP